MRIYLTSLASIALLSCNSGMISCPHTDWYDYHPLPEAANAQMKQKMAQLQAQSSSIEMDVEDFVDKTQKRLVFKRRPAWDAVFAKWLGVMQWYESRYNSRPVPPCAPPRYELSLHFKDAQGATLLSLDSRGYPIGLYYSTQPAAPSADTMQVPMVDFMPLLRAKPFSRFK